MAEMVVLVDEKDRELGAGEKLAVHREGSLHRAFSIFVFNSKGQLMLQKRASSKYHSGGLWTNTTCSHPRPGENLEDAIHRRLMEEMGFDTALQEAFHFVYKVHFSNGLFEHELDHVFTGMHEDAPEPDPEEVEGWKWISMLELEKDMKAHPDNYTYWFKAAMPELVKHLKKSAPWKGAKA